MVFCYNFFLQDISAEEAHQLHSLLSILVERGSEIFQNVQDTNSESAENSWVKIMQTKKKSAFIEYCTLNNSLATGHNALT